MKKPIIVTQIDVSRWIWLLPSLAKAHRLWTDLMVQYLGAGLGLPWHELVLTCLNNGLMARWPWSHSPEVKLCECLLWGNQGSHSTRNHCSFCLLRLALEQPSNLSWEASEHEADSGEKAYRNNPTWGPTDSGGR